MTWLIELIVAVLSALLPGLIRASTPTSEEAAPQPELKRRLKASIRAKWKLPAMLLLAMALMLGGCNPRTVYVPHGEPVRIRQTVRNARVWVLDHAGKPVAGVMDLPEGWWALSDPGPDPSK